MKNNGKIKIGIDFHGVFDAKPQYFSMFCKDAIKQGWEIHIISGGPEEKIREYLKRYDAPYTKVYTILGEAQQLGIVKYQNNSFHIDDAFWDEAKAKYCKKNKVSLHIDNSPEYGKYFSTEFCLYDVRKNSCQPKNNAKEIVFEADIDKTLKKIGDYLDFKS